MERRGESFLMWAVALFGMGLYLYEHFIRPHATHAAHKTHTAPAQTVGAAVNSTLPSLIHFLLWIVAIGLVVVTVMVLFRYYMRLKRAKNIQVDEIVLGPDDTAEPFEVMSALDAIHGQLLTRYGGSAIGQNYFTFELFREENGAMHFLLGAPYQWINAIEDIFRAKYTNIRFIPWKGRPRFWPLAQQIVLTKHWRHSTETLVNYQNSVVETIVQGLDRVEGAVHLQYILTPMSPGPMHQRLRQHVRGLEYEARSLQIDDPAQPGVGYADSQVVKDAVQNFGKAVYRTEIRLGADSWDGVQRVYGAIQEANGENQFRAATIILGRGLWNKWVNARIPSMGIFKSNIMFSFPLATLIHLPTARLRINSLNRSLIRRGPAPRAIPRNRDVAILQDETGTVGIPESDRKYNILLVGSQGSGKTTDLLNIIKIDSRYKDKNGLGKSLVLIDIGKDTAKRALGIVPKDREVIWFDPADPACPWTVNPMLASVNDNVLADNVLEGLTEVFGSEAIRARSREFLGNAIMAIRDVMMDDADFTQVYKLLTDSTFRQKIIDSVKDPHQKHYWQGTFTNTMANNPRWLEEGLAAPRNKLDEVLRNPMIRGAMETKHGRRQINLNDVVRGRKILIANLDKSKLGDAGARLLGIMLITMLWHAIQAQSDIKEEDRVPMSLVIDEAQNFISEGFLDILAEGRAYGVQVTVAVRFLGEIASEKVIKGLEALAQNIVVHQFELLEEAEIFMKRFMRVFANMITVAAESQDAVNFGADDFMRLPKYHAVCRFMVDGTPQQAFLAKTIPWESFYDEGTHEHHLSHQSRIVPTPLPEHASSLSAKAADAAAGHLEEAEQLLGEETPSDDLTDIESDLLNEDDGAPVSEGAELGRIDLRGLSSLGDHLTDVLSLINDPDTVQSVLRRIKDLDTGLYTRSTMDQIIANTEDTGHIVGLMSLEGVGREEFVRASKMVVDLTNAMTQPIIVAQYDETTIAFVSAALSKERIKAFGTDVRKGFERLGVSAAFGISVQSADESLEDALVKAHTDLEKGKRKPGGPAKGQTSSKDAGAYANWRENDPLAVYCDHYHVAPQDLKEIQTAMGATEGELRSTAQWMLKRDIEHGKASTTFKHILKLKVEDRLLKPVAAQCGIGLKTLQDFLLAQSITAAEALEAIRKHPEISSLNDLKRAARNVAV